MYLNYNNSNYPMKDLYTVSQLSHKRYEVFDKNTLKHGSKSKLL